MRNATCMNCGTRIDLDIISFCPTCEAERERVRGYRPATAHPLPWFFGIGRGRPWLAISMLVGVLAVIALAIVLIGNFTS